MFLIAGATGSVGGKVAVRLLEDGESVRCLVRPGTSAEALERRGAEIAVGDLRDPASLEWACRDIDVIISTASATRRTDDTPENVDGRGNRNLVEAAVPAGVRRFVLVSTLRASSDSPVSTYRAKGEAESAVRDSGLEYAIVRANAFMDVWFGMFIEAPLAAGRPVTLVGESRGRHSFIAERDVAAFLLAGARRPGARDRTLAIGGPEALDFRDVVHAYESALGRPIPVRRVEPGAPIPGVPEPVWGLAAALDASDSVVPMDELAREFDIELTDARTYARRSALVLGSQP